MIHNQHELGFDVVEEFDLTKLESLVSVGLSDFPEVEDLNWFRSLGKLESLSVNQCRNLRSLNGVENLGQLKVIRVVQKSRLRDIVAIKGLNELEHINIDVGSGFTSQENWDAIADCMKLNRLDINTAGVAFPKFRRTSSVKYYPDDITAWPSYGLPRNSVVNPTVPVTGKFRPNPNMQFLSIADVDLGLQDLSCFREMPNLERLVIHNSGGLKSLEGIQYCKKLKRLEITSCKNLLDISAIESLANLETLSITDSQQEIKHFPVLNCPKLKRLNLSRIHGFKDLEFLRNEENIEMLDLRESGLRSLKGLRHCWKLKKIQVVGSGLTTIGCDIVEAPIQEIDFQDCDWLVDLEGLGNIKNLFSVNLKGCSSLKRLKSISQLTDMEYLDLTGCRSLETLDDLQSMPHVQHVVIKGCISLENVDGLLKLPSLKSLDWSDCPLLKTEDIELLRQKFPSLVEDKDVMD
ncbi:leucine-rich repeat protein [Mariniblastus fucicola]|nr:leucine-rich repeat protein [Mariniblastus fucicola]